MVLQKKVSKATPLNLCSSRKSLPKNTLKYFKILFLFFIMFRYLLVLFFLLVFFRCETNDKERVLLFAPVSTREYFQKTLAQICEKKGCTPSYASSATLARQIAQGAPAHIFVSAHPLWMDYLNKKKLIWEKSRKRLFTNRLMVITQADTNLSHLFPNGFPKTFPITKKCFSHLIQSNNCWILGNTNYVPVGIYSKQALQHMQAWLPMQNKVIPATNSQHAIYSMENGECKLGILYKSDVIFNQKLRVLYPIPPKYHDPIFYEVALVRNLQKKQKRTAIEVETKSKKIFRKLLSLQKKQYHKKLGFQ